MLFRHYLSGLLLCLCPFPGQQTAFAQNYTITFHDPEGDDNGPGSYKYPTDGVYQKGSFDLREASIKVAGDDVEVSIGINGRLEDPWTTGAGFSLQMVFVFIDADDKLLSGHQQSIPGINNKWALGSGWEKCIIISPARPERLNKEIVEKAAALKADILVTDRIMGTGKVITANLKKHAFGNVDLRKCKFQVLMCAYEPFPTEGDLLLKRVKEYEGQHRFGGGNDGECDPNIIDCLAGRAEGTIDEVERQHKILGSYKCNADGSASVLASLPFIGVQADQLR